MNHNPTALITGASSGIGEELCREFARNGYSLVITARDMSKLELVATRLRRAYRAEVMVLPADLTKSESPRMLYEQIQDRDIRVDVLVNNAGFGYAGYFIHNRPGLQERMLRLNIMAPTRLCRLFLPDLLSQGHGGILNLCSTGSFVPGPMNAVYCASKAYLLSLTEALAEEAEGTGVVVTALCPGATSTNFARNAHMETSRLFHFGVLDPATVARNGFRSLAKGKRVSVVGAANRAMIGAIRLVPRIAAAKASKFIQVPYAMPPCN